MTYPEGDLWRARTDGSERLQLTFSPMSAAASVWSPDGKTIAFEGQLPGHHRKIYFVPAKGGTPRLLTTEDRSERSPTWSPDANLLAFSAQGAIHIFDVESEKSSELVGSEGARWPTWSPDGRYLAACSSDYRKLLLFDFATQRWQVLAEIDIWEQFWSPDGKSLYVVSPWWLGADRSVHRISISDGSTEQIVPLRDIRQPWGSRGMWVGLTPDGSLLLLRDQSIHHIYALDLEY